eukprot:TRINITY_DN66979_c8_g3_i2.p1 TRINITY_DN66979_c8_g3~~TRINITY_DN66979_c8_g3_i2.p1  ORF type:complete len:622 (-),score=262.82 TRINITY_DN66979_c8_g3_i2:103-1968(-)
MKVLSRSVVVRGIPAEVSGEVLCSVLAECGEVVRSRFAGQLGVVEFDSDEAVVTAMALSGTALGSGRLEIVSARQVCEEEFRKYERRRATAEFLQSMDHFMAQQAAEQKVNRMTIDEAVLTVDALESALFDETWKFGDDPPMSVKEKPPSAAAAAGSSSSAAAASGAMSSSGAAGNAAAALVDESMVPNNLAVGGATTIASAAAAMTGDTSQPDSSLESSQRVLEEIARTIYVGNMTGETTDTMVYDLFSSMIDPNIGEVYYIKIVTEPAGYRFAFVEFSTSAAADTALGLAGTMLDGRPLKIGRSNRPIFKTAVANKAGEMAGTVKRKFIPRSQKMAEAIDKVKEAQERIKRKLELKRKKKEKKKLAETAADADTTSTSPSTTTTANGQQQEQQAQRKSSNDSSSAGATATATSTTADDAAASSKKRKRSSSRDRSKSRSKRSSRSHSRSKRRRRHRSRTRSRSRSKRRSRHHSRRSRSRSRSRSRDRRHRSRHHRSSRSRRSRSRSRSRSKRDGSSAASGMNGNGSGGQQPRQQSRKKKSKNNADANKNRFWNGFSWVEKDTVAVEPGTIPVITNYGVMRAPSARNQFNSTAAMATVPVAKVYMPHEHLNNNNNNNNNQ